MRTQFKIPFTAHQKITNKAVWIYLAFFLLIIAVRGFNWGIEFTGGHLMRIGFLEQAVTDNALREALSDKSIGLEAGAEFVVQDVESIDKLAGYKAEKLIQLPMLTPEQREATLKLLEQKFGKIKPPDSEVVVGPSVGDDMRRIAVVCFVASCLMILVYMYFRFEWHGAVGSVLGLIHDSIVTMGVLAIIGMEINLSVVAALLTILGFSLNDSIVILDRVRENRKIFRKLSFAEMVDLSLNQTLTRTIFTSLTVVFPLICLFFFGGSALHPFSLTLLIGVTTGTYSSIYVASAWVIYKEGAGTIVEEAEARA